MTDSPPPAPVKLGVLGAGMIATVFYGFLPGLAHLRDSVEVVAIADADVARADAVARAHGIPHSGSSLDWLLEQDVEVILNITPIGAHAATSRRILESGRHLITEKPLATRLDEADALVELSEARGLTVVCSPMSAIHPTIVEARRLLDAGTIGRVAFARVHSSNAGPGGSRSRPWPANPSWFYTAGSGPLFDMGVYGIHSLTALLGPAQRVVGFSGITDPVRIVRGGPFDGVEMPVSIADNNLFMLDFGDATFAVVDGSFTLHATRSPEIELFGRGGTISIPDVMGDPEMIRDRPLEVFRTDALPGRDGWVSAGGFDYLGHGLRRVAQLGRAVIVDHAAEAIRRGTPPVLSARHARHALEIMIAVGESAARGDVIDLTTTF